MRKYLLILVVGFVRGGDVQLGRKLAIESGRNLSPLLTKYSTLDFDRRRQYSYNFISDECYYGIVEDAIWCLQDDESSCSTIGDGHKRWVFLVDRDTEYTCFPSSCSGTDLEYFWSYKFEILNSTAMYCALECPEIPFDVIGRSDDGETMRISGTHKYADVSYECAGSTAVTEMSMCEQYIPCRDVTGFTTCTETIKFSIPSGIYTFRAPLHGFSEVCLPNECTDEANLEKLEDFSYASMAWEENMWYDNSLNTTEIRQAYLINWSCDDDAAEKKNNALYLKLGIIIGALVLFCCGAVCFLRFHFSREVILAQDETVELQNREGLDSRRGPDMVEIGIEDTTSSSDSILDSERPIHTNHGMECGEVDHL